MHELPKRDSLHKFFRAAIMSELAEKFHFKYETCKAAIDESAIGNRRAQPGLLVTLLAKAKADAIIKQAPRSEGYLLTCDQVSTLHPLAQHYWCLTC